MFQCILIIGFGCTNVGKQLSLFNLMPNTILITESEQRNIDIMQRFLKAAGFETFTALNGTLAIQLIQSGKVLNMVIIDLDMTANNISGRDVANECCLKAIPFLIISGGALKEQDIGFLANCGYSFTDIFHKPLDLYKMHERIKLRLNTK